MEAIVMIHDFRVDDFRHTKAFSGGIRLNGVMCNHRTGHTIRPQHLQL